MAYAAKYASGFYGPFRDAVRRHVAWQGGKSTYQMDPANSDEAMHEIALDLARAPTWLLSNQACLVLIFVVPKLNWVPCIAYQASGEYAMLYGAFDQVA